MTFSSLYSARSKSATSTDCSHGQEDISWTRTRVISSIRHRIAPTRRALLGTRQAPTLARRKCGLFPLSQMLISDALARLEHLLVVSSPTFALPIFVMVLCITQWSTMKRESFDYIACTVRTVPGGWSSMRSRHIYIEDEILYQLCSLSRPVPKKWSRDTHAIQYQSSSTPHVVLPNVSVARFTGPGATISSSSLPVL